MCNTHIDRKGQHCFNFVKDKETPLVARPAQLWAAWAVVGGLVIGALLVAVCAWRGEGR